MKNHQRKTSWGKIESWMKSETGRLGIELRIAEFLKESILISVDTVSYSWLTIESLVKKN